jgi:lipoyl(octanoyl) transferase
MNIQNIKIKQSYEKKEYENTIKFMEKRVENIFINKEKELIWCLNYNHIYTIGTSGKTSDVHSNINIPIIKTNRGGKTTYHGPGQRIIYFLINLNIRKKDIRKFIDLIEVTTIKLLKNFNIQANTFSDRVGIWVTKNNGIKIENEEKIGAIGLRIKKWVTYHGLSFNLEPDLSYYNNIEACGLPNYSTTSMKKLGIELSQKDFDSLYLKIFLKELNKL